MAKRLQNRVAKRLRRLFRPWLGFATEGRRPLCEGGEDSRLITKCHFLHKSVGGPSPIRSEQPTNCQTERLLAL
jgi:hypothetical protein